MILRKTLEVVFANRLMTGEQQLIGTITFNTPLALNALNEPLHFTTHSW